MSQIVFWAFMEGHGDDPAEGMLEEERDFIEEHAFLIDLPNSLPDWFAEFVCLTAFRLGRTCRRPMYTNQTTPTKRQFVPNPSRKLKAMRIFHASSSLMRRLEQGEQTPAVREELDRLLNFTARYFFIPAPPAKRARRTRTPCMTSVSNALRYYENNARLFADIFCGWSPGQVRQLAKVLVEFIPELDKGVTNAEEKILIVLARLKQNVASWTCQAFVFQRSTGFLCTEFTKTTGLILDRFDWLIGLKGLERIPHEFVQLSEQAIADKYKQFKKDPSATLPDEYRASSALMDGSHFPICRPGGDPEADVQRAFYTAYKKSHTINVLFIVLANGLRIYAGFAAGRHADPFSFTDELEAACRQAGLVLLCDAIFARNDVCKPMLGLADNTMSPLECVLASALRIPVEWAMLLTQDMPLLRRTAKIKFFHTRPRALIELAVLLANFKLCLNGESITTYFGMQPPSLRAYLNGAVHGCHEDDDDDDFNMFASEDEENHSGYAFGEEEEEDEEEEDEQ